MIHHPMQKCPAEFVPVFQEILENSWWDDPEPTYICHRIDKLYYDRCISGIQVAETVEWIVTWIA